MRSRKLLALIFSLLAVAPALAGYMTLLGAGAGGSGIAPVASWNAATDSITQLTALVTPSRASSAMMFDSTGKLTYAPNNLLTYSNTFSNAAWTKQNVTLTNANAVSDPVGGTDATTVTATAGGGAAQLYFTFSATTAPNVIQAIWIKRRTGSGAITLVINGSSKSLAVNGSWQFLSGSGAPGTGPYFFQLTFATSGDAVDIYAASNSAVTYETTPRTGDQVITTAAAYYGPRVDYDPNTLAVKGLLIEEARTNYATYSNNMAGGTLTASGGAIAGGVADLSGGTTGITFTATAGNATHHAIKTGGNSLTAGTKYTATFWLKQGNAAYTVFGEIGDTPYVWGSIKWSDLSVQTNGQDGAIVSTPIAFGGGIYQVSITYTRTITGASILGFGPNTVSAATIGNAANIFNAAGTETAICVAWQIEAGAFSTSFIPTAAASVTRAPDVVQFTGAALAAASGSAATLISEWDAINASLVVSAPTQFGTTGGYSLLRINNATTLLSMSTAGNSASLTVASGTWTANFRVGLAYNSSGFTLAANGASASSAAAFTSPSTVYVGNLNGVANYSGNHHLRSFAIYNQRLPDATLKAKTVVGAPYAANDNGVRFAFANDNVPTFWRLAL